MQCILFEFYTIAVHVQPFCFNSLSHIFNTLIKMRFIGLSAVSGSWRSYFRLCSWESEYIYIFISRSVFGLNSCMLV